MFDLILLSRGIIVGAWTYAAVSLWKYRNLPYANGAIAGALAMILCQLLLIFGTAIPFSTMLFFIAMSQLTIVGTMVRMIRSFHKNTENKVPILATTVFGLLAFSFLLLASIGM